MLPEQHSAQPTSKQFVTATRISSAIWHQGPWTTNCSCTARDVLFGNGEPGFLLLCTNVLFYEKHIFCHDQHSDRTVVIDNNWGQIRKQIEKNMSLYVFEVPCVLRRFQDAYSMRLVFYGTFPQCFIEIINP